MLDHANIVDQILNLELTTTFLLTDTDMHLYEEMDCIITRYMKKAEKKCRKLYMGGIPFSPDLVIHLNLIKFWRIIIRKKKVVAQICVP